MSQRIARGGMGAVYRALDRASGEVVALKRVAVDDPMRRELYLAAFEREYQVLASLDHPHIVRVYDYGVDADGPYYTMELVRGPDLSKAAPVRWRDACLLMRDVASSLSLLHARHLLHRDLSPSNVKIGADGHGKLLDFGALANFGAHDLLVGTPPFVPPEAMDGASLDQRSDLYSLGALIYWALTGTHAFPATRLEQLERLWEDPPLPPSSQVFDVPRALDELVLALLSRDALARPASAAEVISRLTSIGELAPGPEDEQRRIAQSFLIAPPFVGRADQLEILGARLRQALDKKGCAVRIESLAGSGRSRLMDELGIRAQLSGATLLRVDASMHPNHNGTARALAQRLLDALPGLARESAKRYGKVVENLGSDIAQRVSRTPSSPSAEEPATDAGADLSDWLIEVSRQKPLVITVDNLEACDSTSLGVLVSLATRLKKSAVLLLVAERLRREPVPSKGLAMLRAHSETLPLSNLIPAETELLARSLFDDAPNVGRFADWLHGRTSGSPLHCVETTRLLIERGVVRHEGGMWLLPAGRPQVELPEELEDALLYRVANLSPKALELAQLLSLQRGEPSLALCTILTEPTEERGAEQEALQLLDELARSDVLYSDPAGYRFVSAVLRDALLDSMGERVSMVAHRRLGEALEQSDDPELRVEAGWHFMRGGDELRGADLVASVLSVSETTYDMVAQAFRLGSMAEAALQIYKRHRFSAYKRLPLLAALALSGYFEEYQISLKYSDEALDTAEQLAGLGLARDLRRWLGTPLALMVALTFAWLRFMAAPKSDRPYSWSQLLRYVFSAVVPLVAASSTVLDPDRADRVTRVLEPFSKLPEWTTPRVMYDCCFALQQIGREHQPLAFDSFGRLADRIGNLRRYPLLPKDARHMLHSAMHLARASFGIFRVDTDATLQSIAMLESSRYKLYGMLTNQLRSIYHANRGELAEAARHRVVVEVYAAQIGSAWQIELWEPAALLPLHLSTGDVVEVARITRRFDELVQIAPSLELYRTLSQLALELVSHEGVEERILDQAAHSMRLVRAREPRSFIGWATVYGANAMAFNRLGRHREAREICEEALRQMTDADRDYVSLFLEVDLQAALADAYLGHIEPATQRIDGLLQRFQASEHPMTLGRLHETRARIAHVAGRLSEYREHLAQMERYYRPTNAPALISKCERLARLHAAEPTRPISSLPPFSLDTVATHITVRRH